MACNEMQNVTYESALPNLHLVLIDTVESFR